MFLHQANLLRWSEIGYPAPIYSCEFHIVKPQVNPTITDSITMHSKLYKWYILYYDFMEEPEIKSVKATASLDLITIKYRSLDGY